MSPSQEVKALRKAGRLHEAYSQGYALLAENPNDDDVCVSQELASRLEDGQMVNIVVAKKLDKKKNRWGLTAIAVLDE